MKHIKSFNQYKVNETLDMFMMPVDPLDGWNDVWSDFKTSMKKSYQDFMKRLRQEGKETKEAWNLVVKSTKDGKELSDKEKQKVWTQLKDIFKSIGLGAVSAVPGSVGIFMLIKFFKLEKHLLPSSFID